MGDRTYVTLTVPVELKDVAFKIAAERYTNSCEKSADDKLASFGFEEVNYGELPFLNELQDHGIAYESRWGAGSEYGAGQRNCRFTPEGTVIVKDHYDSGDNPNLHELVTRLDDHEALRSYIQQHIEMMSVLPWDNQVEYGKRYLARKLIGATP